MTKEKQKTAILWLLPMALFLGLFVMLPLLVTLKDSLYQISLMDTSSAEFSGLSNYFSVLGDSSVINAVRNTLFYLLVALTAEFTLGITIALALKEQFRGRGFLLGVLILPWALPPLVNGILWRLIFDPTSGLWNHLLFEFGLIETYQVWLNDPVFSRWLVIGVHVWKMLPLVTIIFLARLQTLPHEYLEAAKIDGAGFRDRLIHIVLPYLKPVFFLVFAQGAVGAFHLFDEAYAMTGIALDTRPVLLQNYLIAFREYNLGTGMALSLLISAAILLLMALFYVLTKGDEETW